MSREFPNSSAAIRNLSFLPNPVYIPLKWIKATRNLCPFLCRWCWELIHVPQSHLRFAPVATGWSKSEGSIRFRRWDRVPRTYCGPRWAGRRWARGLRWRPGWFPWLSSSPLFWRKSRIFFVHNGSLSEKIKRGKMTKIFVAFNSVPEALLFF